MGSRYPGGLPGGVPSEVYEAYDSERALEIARDINQFSRERIDQLPE
jgi:HEPN domain-containing protein